MAGFSNLGILKQAVQQSFRHFLNARADGQCVEFVQQLTFWYSRIQPNRWEWAGKTQEYKLSLLFELRGNFRADLAARNQSFMPDSELRKGIERKGFILKSKRLLKIPVFHGTRALTSNPKDSDIGTNLEGETPPLEKIL